MCMCMYMQVDQTLKYAYDIPVLPTPVGLKKRKKQSCEGKVRTMYCKRKLFETMILTLKIENSRESYLAPAGASLQDEHNC